MKYVTILILLGFISAQSQSIDTDFQDPLPIRAATIEDIKVQPDRKILIGGDIAFYENQRVHNLIRLNDDGSLDASFNFNFNNPFLVVDLDLMSNGNIVALLRKYESNRYIIYLETILMVISSDGTILQQINGLTGGATIAVQPDDKVLLAEGSSLKRYSSTLQPDNDFNSGVMFNNALTDIEVFDGKIYISGTFSEVNGVTRHDVARLEMNGTLDTSFDTANGTDDFIGSITLQADGKVLLGKCYINEFNGQSGYSGMLRLNSNGSVDHAFTPPRLNGGVSEIVAMPDGMLYAAAFLDYQNETADRFFKMLPTGELDTSFDPIKLNEFGSNPLNIAVANGSILLDNSSISGNVFGLSRFSMDASHDNGFKPEVARFGTITIGDYFQGKLTVAGDFIRINGFETFGIARLNLNGTLDETFVQNMDLGSVKQIEILDEDNILVSTYKNFFKLSGSGSVKPDFNFAPFEDLYQVIKFIVLPDGKIMVADANTIRRLTANGEKDITFDIGSGIDDISSTAFDFDMQGDKVIYGSFFKVFNSQNVKSLIRLSPNGSIDNGFDVGAGPVNSNAPGWSGISLIKVLDNNEILVGGSFTDFADQPVAHRLVKLNENGAIDLEFNNNQANAPAPNEVYFMDAQVEQIASRIFIRQRNSPNLYVIETNGTVVTDFVIPSQTALINHLIAVSQTPNNGRVAGVDENLFALGLFQEAGKENPSFILRIQLAEVITALENKEDRIIESTFPNPFYDKFQVTLSKSINNPNLTLLDLSGKEIRVEPVFYSQNEIQIDLSIAPPGLYFLKVTTLTGQSEVVKVVKSQ